jgi:hypothetical protein
MYPGAMSALKDIVEGRGETVDQTKVLAVLILSTWAINHKLPDMVRLVIQKNKWCLPNTYLSPLHSTVKMIPMNTRSK